jgi:hypothetical protein
MRTRNTLVAVMIIVDCIILQQNEVRKGKAIPVTDRGGP